MQYNRKSSFVKFAKAYSDKMGKFEVDATGQRIYDEDVFWEAFLIKREYELRNRGNNSKKVKV